MAERSDKDYVYPKKLDCPICEQKIIHYTVKSGKTRLIRQDDDLRPVYNGIDTVKYDVVHCNICGYAALKLYHGPLASVHKKMIIDKIASVYRPMKELDGQLTYEEAFVRYKLAMLNAVTRNAKDSEKGLLCLKMGWLLRGMMEHLDEVPDTPEYSEEKLAGMEEAFMKDAMEFFIAARSNERPPIAGMNEVTLDYLIAVLCIRFEKYSDASRLITDVLQSPAAGSGQKDKARDLMLTIREKMEK